MCFLLYAGTTRPIPRRDWNIHTPDISARSIKGDEDDIRCHFSQPEIQHIGSTSGCGCDFPWVSFQNDDWPELGWNNRDAEQLASDSMNRAALGELLRSLGEDRVELYGVWAGNYALEPACREELSIEALLNSSFYLKERGFYTIRFRD
jgi:hypothetical protein